MNNNLNNLNGLNNSTIINSQQLQNNQNLQSSSYSVPNTGTTYNNKPNRNWLYVIIALAVIVLIGVGCIFLFKNKEVEKSIEETNNHETYRKIYTSSDNELYFVNDEEKVYSFSGYGQLEDYFYKNVNRGYSEGKYFLINIDKKYIVEPGIYDYINRAADSQKYYYIKKNKMEGIIDYTGKVIIPTEYTQIKHHEYDDFEFFIAEKEKENYLFSENGALLLKTTDDISSYDIEGFEPICSKCSPTILYDNTLYNANDGSILLENLNGIFKPHMYYSYDDNSLTIYDEKYNVKEKIADIDIIGLELTEDGRPMVNGSPDLYLNDKLELVDMEQEKEEEHKKFIKENGFSEIEDGNYHILSNKSKYITKVDTKSNSIIVYDHKGNELKTIEVGNAKNIKDIESMGNYFVATYGFRDKKYVFNVDGEWVAEDASSVSYKDNGILYVSYYLTSDDFALLHDNFELTFSSEYNSYITKFGFIIHDKVNKKVTLYDLNGKIKNELNNISEHHMLGDNYIIFSTDDGQHTIIDTNDGKITLEYLDLNDSNNSHNYYQYDKDNIAVIETSDGFYSPSGKKLIDKK